jgi:hypothetical protein
MFTDNRYHTTLYLLVVSGGGVEESFYQYPILIPDYCKLYQIGKQHKCQNFKKTTGGIQTDAEIYQCSGSGAFDSGIRDG